MLKVSGKTKPYYLSKAIINELHKNGKKEAVEVRAIGADAVNRAVKAIILARRFSVQEGFDLNIYPDFVEINLGDQIVTAVTFMVLQN